MRLKILCINILFKEINLPMHIVNKEVYVGHRWEIRLESEIEYENQYLDLLVHVTLVSPNGEISKIVGFWDAGKVLTIRFAPKSEGIWTWTSTTSDPNNTALNGQSGSFNVIPYEGDNPVYNHGFLQVREDGRGFEHEDGTPFFWVGDTVWSVSAHAELADWQTFLSHRRKQGFNLMQLSSLPLRGTYD